MVRLLCRELAAAEDVEAALLKDESAVVNLVPRLGMHQASTTRPSRKVERSCWVRATLDLGSKSSNCVQLGEANEPWAHAQVICCADKREPIPTPAVKSPRAWRSLEAVSRRRGTSSYQRPCRPPWRLPPWR